MVWGSDFPFVTEECGYERAAEIVANCGAALSPEETEAVMGGTLARMFPGDGSDKTETVGGWNRGIVEEMGMMGTSPEWVAR